LDLASLNLQWREREREGERERQRERETERGRSESGGRKMLGSTSVRAPMQHQTSYNATQLMRERHRGGEEQHQDSRVREFLHSEFLESGRAR
jgi:hypothetical protein